MAEFELDYLVLFDFNTDLAILQAEEYVRQILLGVCGARVVVIGYNHTFGRKREGDHATLQTLGPQLGFRAIVVEPVIFGGEPVHSSRIRKDLFEGRFAESVHMLTRPYRITGMVVKGRGVGRTIGFPTINIRAEEDKLIPMSGVYAARVRVDGTWWPGMMYIGDDRRIFDLEVSLFDFSGDLYGRELSVDVYARTRDSMTFDNMDDLTAQIGQDEKDIRTILAGI